MSPDLMGPTSAANEDWMEAAYRTARPRFYSRMLEASLDARPTVGRLMELCEESYRLVSQLAPQLRQMRGSHRSCREGGMDLHLEILEQTQYTTLLHLTYYFAHCKGQLPDPDAVLRVYHDARQVEVIRLRQTALPLNRGRQLATLKQKWRINLFLSRWLGYCALEGHGFAPESPPASRPPEPVLETG